MADGTDWLDVEVLEPTRDRPTEVEVSTEDDWEAVPLTCAISCAPLVDPAVGSSCLHRARCNFETLQDYVSRSMQCPVMGCSAGLKRKRDVRRDEGMLALLRGVPSGITKVWIRDAEVSMDPPTSSLGGARRKRTREEVELS